MHGLRNILFNHGGRHHGFGDRGRDWTWEEGWREWGRPGPGSRGGPRVDRGEVKYLILSILQDGPKHGYEIIRSIEEKSQGTYVPSAGTIYPTLQLLEDMAYLQGREADGRKVFTLTDAGRTYLAEHQEQAQTAWTRFVDHHGHGPDANVANDAQRQVRDALGGLGRTLFAEGRIFRASPATLKRVGEILEKARVQIEASFAEVL
jgi:DNA-binding PadR family transcriptional regulator